MLKDFDFTNGDYGITLTPTVDTGSGGPATMILVNTDGVFNGFSPVPFFSFQEHPEVYSNGVAVYGTSQADDIQIGSFGFGMLPRVFAYGGDGDDRVFDGSDGNNELHGGAGSDWLSAGRGNDLLYGDSGNDVFDMQGGAAGTRNVWGGSGHDLFVTSVALNASSPVVIHDMEAGEKLLLGDLYNFVNVAAHIHPTITGDGNGGALVHISNGSDIDLLGVDPATLGLVRGVAVDESGFVSSAQLDAFITTTGGSLTGTSGADMIDATHYQGTLNGLEGNDTILGGAGADTILGGTGDDSLTGGVGADILTGGAGADYFVFDPNGDSGAKSSTRDTITDFNSSENDKIELSGDGVYEFLGTSGFTFSSQGIVAGDIPHQIYYTISGGDTYIQGDNNGDGKADFSLKLVGVHNLTASDFIFHEVTPVTDYY